ARIRAVTRRAASPETSAPIRLGGYVVDLDNRRITLAAAQPEGGTQAGHGWETDQEVHLTPTQWQLLEVLLRSPGRLISQRQLLTEVWGPQYETETHYVRQYMAQLRHKLEPDPARPRHLITELGMGYRYVP
ncbi:MAG: winged helix-turn-helix domain-containing protein, partial [Mycobacteriaceae bacterium]